MNNQLARSNRQGYEIYPKRYFPSSPTHFQWNKLTCADLHALHTIPGFEGQGIYFHLNHPIQFVRLVGLVVGIDLTPGGKHLLLTLDDGSGACIEVKVEVRKDDQNDAAEYPSTTLVNNLDVMVELGLPSVSIDHKPLQVGTVIKAKGTIDSFRGTRQLKLERIWIVPDTNAEAKEWAETAKWKRDVLAKPWVLTEAQKKETDAKIERDAVKERERQKKRKALSHEHYAKKMRKEEKREEKRRREEIKMDMGALVGSGVLPARVTDS